MKKIGIVAALVVSLALTGCASALSEFFMGVSEGVKSVSSSDLGDSSSNSGYSQQLYALRHEPHTLISHQSGNASSGPGLSTETITYFYIYYDDGTMDSRYAVDSYGQIRLLQVSYQSGNASSGPGLSSDMPVVPLNSVPVETRRAAAKAFE